MTGPQNECVQIQAAYEIVQKVLRGCVRALQGALAGRGASPGAKPEPPRPAAPRPPPEAAIARDAPGSQQEPGGLAISQQGGRSVRRKLDFGSCSAAVNPAAQGQQPPLGLAFSAAAGNGAVALPRPVQPPRPPPMPARPPRGTPAAYDPFSAGGPAPPSTAPPVPPQNQLHRPQQAPPPPRPPPPVRPSVPAPQRPLIPAPRPPPPPMRAAPQPGPPRPPPGRAAPSPPLHLPSADAGPRLMTPFAGGGFPQPPHAPAAAFTASGPQPPGSMDYRPPPPPPPPPMQRRQHPQQQLHPRLGQPLPPCPRPPPGSRPDGTVGPRLLPRGPMAEAANNACGQGAFRGPPVARYAFQTKTCRISCGT
jgi:hypothetical protein